MIDESQQWMMLLRAVLSLVAVIGIIISLAWLVKKYWRPDRWGMSLSGIKLLHHLPLDSKKKILVIEVENRRFLVGVGADSISNMLELGEAPQATSDEVKYVEQAF